MRSRRGFLLVSVLLITLILLTLGVTFLGKRAMQYRRAALMEATAQARALAESGLEDAILKLRRDLNFPPVREDQTEFTYTEDVSPGGQRVGGYQVTIDASFRQHPYRILIIRSTGVAGPDPARPTAKRTFRAEFDVSRPLRENIPQDDSVTNNPTYYLLINFQDLGGL